MRPRRSTVVVFAAIAGAWFVASYLRWAYASALPEIDGPPMHPDRWLQDMLAQALHSASKLAFPLASSWHEAPLARPFLGEIETYVRAASAFGANGLFWASIVTTGAVAATRLATRTDRYYRRVFAYIAILWFSMSFVLPRIYGALIWKALESGLLTGWVRGPVGHVLSLTMGPDWMDWPIGTALEQYHHYYPHLGYVSIDYPVWAASLALNALFWAFAITLSVAAVRRALDRRAASKEA